MIGDPGEQVSERWAQWRRDIPLDEFHERWKKLEAKGAAPHGEADFLERLHPGSVLDAGCGMGRVAIELARRGIEADGVDLDDDLLAYARYDAPAQRWVHGNLAAVDMGRTYDVVAMPGNVMLFCSVADRGPILDNLARHLQPTGRLVAGFGLDQGDDALTLTEYDSLCRDAGLVLVDRYGTWDGDQYRGGNYAVSVHRRR